MVGVPACLSSSRVASAHREEHLALSATVPCVTLFHSGAQAGAMPTDGELISAAATGKVGEVRRLLEAGANIDERDIVSGGVGTSVCSTWCGV